jgi:murein DD-endopeptidase MepM/ murein hydrolase activator NlpD
MKRFLWVAFAVVLGLSIKAEAADEISGIALSSAPLTAPATAVVEPFVWPVAKIVAGHQSKIVSGFGKRKVPDVDPAQLGKPSDQMELHEGVDFAVPVDTPVRAARSGKVIFAGFSSAYASRLDKTEKSRLVILQHSDKTSSRYVHVDHLRVRPGDSVVSGQALASVTDSDEWEKPVLHFEIRDENGRALDPAGLLQEVVPGAPR